MKIWDYYIGKKFGENIHEGSGLIAEDKEHAKTLLEEQFGLQWRLQFSPVRKNQKKDMYRVSLYPKEEVESFIARQCEKVSCTECGSTFRRMMNPKHIEMYDCLGEDRRIYCGSGCYERNKVNREVENASSYGEWVTAVIYCITQKSTGKKYVGQTVRSWTLRWWEHFTQWTADKFQSAISAAKLTDWTFEILETISISDLKWNPKLLTEIEVRWIQKLDSIDNGFNTRLDMKHLATTNKVNSPLWQNP